MPEPSNSQARRIRDEVQTLLQVAAAQQAESRSETKERCRSISNHPLEEGKRRLPKTTSSIINGDTMHDTTSTSTVVVDMGMQRNAATVPTAADDTTVTRTGWL